MNRGAELNVRSHEADRKPPRHSGDPPSSQGCRLSISMSIHGPIAIVSHLPNGLALNKLRFPAPVDFSALPACTFQAILQTFRGEPKWPAACFNLRGESKSGRSGALDLLVTAYPFRATVSVLIA